MMPMPSTATISVIAITDIPDKFTRASASDVSGRAEGTGFMEVMDSVEGTVRV